VRARKERQTAASLAGTATFLAKEEGMQGNGNDRKFRLPGCKDMRWSEVDA
jgi:hypothetical protein